MGSGVLKVATDSPFKYRENLGGAEIVFRQGHVIYPHLQMDQSNWVLDSFLPKVWGREVETSSHRGAEYVAVHSTVSKLVQRFITCVDCSVQLQWKRQNISER